VSSLYGNEKQCRQRFRHRYQLTRQGRDTLAMGGMIFSGACEDYNDIEQILELPNRSFFVATQGHPEFTSRPLNPDPMFLGLTKAILERKYNG